MPNPPSPTCRPGRGRSRLAALLLATAVTLAGCGLLFHRDLPRTLVGLPPTLSASDAIGLAEVRKLHGRRLEIQTGAFAIYGSGAVSIWVAGARDTVVARRLMNDMVTRIGRGDTPFQLDTTRIVAQREVRELSGLGQRHFCFRVGRRVVWLSANRREADAALEEALHFYH